MRKSSGSDEQQPNHSTVTHVVTWLIPLPTLLPVEDGETFEFQDLGIPPNGGQRITIRLVSDYGVSEDLALTEMLMRRRSNDLKIPQHGDREQLEAWLGELKRREQTLAEVTADIGLSGHDNISQEQQISIAFDQALEHIRSIQQSIFVLDKIPRPSLSTQSLPTIVPFSLQSTLENEPTLELGIYTIPSVMKAQSHWFRSESSFEGDTDALLPSSLIHESLSRYLANGPFSDYSELINEAQVAALNAGLPRAAALTAATAGEVLLDEALRCVLWESRHTPEEAASIFAKERDFKPRTTKNLPKFLHGAWRAKGDGTIARWFNDVYQLRHLIVHSGVYPSTSEVQNAIFTTLELNDFLADRFADRHKEFPRTSLFLLGLPGLSRRELLSPEIKELMEDHREPDWVNTFTRWRHSVKITREHLRHNQRLVGNLESSRIIFWVHTSGTYKWVVYDPDAYASAEVDVNSIHGIADDELRHIRNLVEQACTGELEEPLVRDFPLATIEDDSSLNWQLPYKNLPMENVMVDKREFDF